MELYIFRQFNNIKISNIHIDAKNFAWYEKHQSYDIENNLSFQNRSTEQYSYSQIGKVQIDFVFFFKRFLFHHSRINNHVFIKRIFSLSYFPISHFLKNLHYIIRRIRLYNVVRVKWKLARRHILKSFVTVLVRSIGDKKGQVEFMKKYYCFR